jgi:hypothetical protein
VGSPGTTTIEREGGSCYCGHEQPVAAAKTRPVHLALEDLQLVAKYHQLDIAVQMIGGACDKLDKAAQQQVHEREEHGREPPRRKRPHPTNSLAAATIVGFCALQSSPPLLPRAVWPARCRIRHDARDTVAFSDVRLSDTRSAEASRDARSDGVGCTGRNRREAGVHDLSPIP